MTEDSGAHEILRGELAALQEVYCYPVDLQNNLKGIAQEAWKTASKEKRPKNFHISDEQWRTLGYTLARFLEGQRLLELALRNDDLAKIGAIRRFATKLVDAIKDVGLSDDARAKRALTAWLDDQNISLDEFLRFVEFAERLSGFDPRNAVSFNYSSVWPTRAEHRQKTELQGPYFSHLTRGEFQLFLDDWWKATTGGSTSVHDAYETPYKSFLRTLLEPIKEKRENVAGYSPTAVINARRDGEKSRALRQQKMQSLAENLRLIAFHLRNIETSERP